MTHRTPAGMVLASLLLSGCWGQDAPEAPMDEGVTLSAPAASSRDTVRETPNVWYKGVIRPGGTNQQGTHRLLLEDGRYILLEAERIDLNGYVDEQVEAFGSSRPTPDGAGIILNVSRVQLVSDGEASSEAVVSSVSSAPAASSASSVAPQVMSSAPSADSGTAQSAPRQETGSPEFIAQGREEWIVQMSREKTDPSLWTQQYCTGHVDFCIPVHKNWWFKSFGTTSTDLWHVEIGPEELLNLGDGPIVVRLLSGTAEGASAADGDVLVRSGTVTGYKNWADNRHFQISADARLEPAVRTILGGLKAQDLP